MENEYQLAVTTCPDEQVAEQVARYLIENNVAACVSLLPKVRSIYRWQGAITSDSEVMLFIKTRKDRYAELEQAILSQHPYELPELIAIPINMGLPGYLRWIDESVSVS
ncbi:MAG: divalent-cation tolerance protein CutA [Gammaproteobacteria bacterium]|nr:divalent-cation tolerance protein CutA [Gammaproteobacteria bacterium]